MHILKKILCVIAVTPSLTFGAEQLPETPTTPSLVEANIRTLREQLKADQQAFGQQLEASIKKSLKRGWPMSARLVALALASIIAYEHKDSLTQENAKNVAKETAENAKALWNEKTAIARTVKYSAASAYYQIKDTLLQRKATQEKAQEEVKASSEADKTDVLVVEETK
jgi:hypothetical protein